jgi:hypothetical protein
MSSYVSKCQSISLESTIDFQEIFAFNDEKGIRRYTPFESIESPHSYFPLATIGEIGGIIDPYCKTGRHRRDYTFDAINESADSFIYFLNYGLILKNTLNESDDLIESIRNNWSKTFDNILNERDLLKVTGDTIYLLSKLKNKKDRTLNNYSSIFKGIKTIGEYVTKMDWQVIIDKFHHSTLDMHLDPKRYTNDFWFQGSGKINFMHLLSWIKEQTKEGCLEVPKDLIKVFERYAKISELSDKVIIF